MVSRKNYKDDEKLLIEDLKRKENEAILFLYDEYFPIVKELSLMYNGTEDDAYDILQETILTIYRHFTWDRLDSNNSLKGYIVGIARNLTIANLRIHARDHAEPASNDQAEKTRKDHEATEELLEGNSYQEALLQIMNRCILQLEPKDRRILELFSEGYSYKEIANIMKLKSDSLARYRKFKAKERLFDLIISDTDYRRLKRI